MIPAGIVIFPPLCLVNPSLALMALPVSSWSRNWWEGCRGGVCGHTASIEESGADYSSDSPCSFSSESQGLVARGGGSVQKVGAEAVGRVHVVLIGRGSFVGRGVTVDSVPWCRMGYDTWSFSYVELAFALVRVVVMHDGACPLLCLLPPLTNGRTFPQVLHLSKVRRRY